GGGWLARLRLEVAQGDERTEAVTDEDLRAVMTAAHGAAQRLQVAEELTEARQMPAATTGTSRPSLVQTVRRQSGVLELRTDFGKSVDEPAGRGTPGRPAVK